LGLLELRFAELDNRITSLLRKGIQGSILCSALFSIETFKIAATIVCNAIPAALIGLVRMALHLFRLALRLPTALAENWLAGLSRRLPIWGSLSTAFERALRRQLFGDAKLADVRRKGLEVVINTCDLRTQTAFRFGSAGWRYGHIRDNDIEVAKAVAASAAFPLLLPPLVEDFDFERQKQISAKRVVLTDGGVFDNLGVNVVEPERDGAVSVHTYSVSHIISANAGVGQMATAARSRGSVASPRPSEPYTARYRTPPMNGFIAMSRAAPCGDLA